MTKTVNIKGMPVKLWKRLRALHYETGMTFAEMVTEALELWLKSRNANPN